MTEHHHVGRSPLRSIGILILVASMVGAVGCPAPPPTGNNPSAVRDSDGDGFPDAVEVNGIPSSDPNDPEDTPISPIDTDGDGCSDYDETHFDGFCDNDPNSSAPPSVDPDAAHTFSLRVARHVEQPFSELEVDAVFQEAGRLLQTVQTECPDVAANVTFQREGALETFDVAPAVITTESQLDAVFDLPHDFKIAHAMVGVCGIVDPDDMAIILGCAATGNSVVIVADAAPDVWAHEWGHVQGLPHRDTCPRNIMHSFEIETNAINDFERNAILTSTPSFAAIRSMAPIDPHTAQPLARTATETIPHWLSRLLTKRYVGGVPARVLPSASREVTAELRLMLWDSGFRGPRRNVVRALGFSGEFDVFGDLTGEIESPQGELTLDEFGVVGEAFLALGRLVPHDPTDEALAYLIAGTDAETWRTRALQWRFQSHENERLHRLLARLSIMGLGVSGDPRALEHLRTLAETDDALSALDELRQQADYLLGLLERPKTAARSDLPPQRQP